MTALQSPSYTGRPGSWSSPRISVLCARRSARCAAPCVRRSVRRQGPRAWPRGGYGAPPPFRPQAPAAAPHSGWRCILPSWRSRRPAYHKAAAAPPPAYRLRASCADTARACSLLFSETRRRISPGRFLVVFSDTWRSLPCLLRPVYHNRSVKIYFVFWACHKRLLAGNPSGTVLTVPLFENIRPPAAAQGRR